MDKLFYHGHHNDEKRQEGQQEAQGAEPQKKESELDKFKDYMKGSCFFTYFILQTTPEQQPGFSPLASPEAVWLHCNQPERSNTYSDIPRNRG